MQAQQIFDENDFDRSSVGGTLKEARLSYHLSLEDVAAHINIRSAYLHAIEEENMAALPARVYAIGFVRSYAEYLGLDANDLVARFKQQKAGERQMRPELHMPIIHEDKQTPGTRLVWISLIAIILIAGTSYTLFGQPPPATQEIPPVPEKLKQSSLAPKMEPVEAPTFAATAEQSAQETSNTGALFSDSELFANMQAGAVDTIGRTSQIELVVTQDSWVEITNPSGQVMVSEVFTPGTRYRLPDKPGFMLTTGNAGGLSLYIDGQAVRPLGRTAEVRRNIVLDQFTAESRAPAAPASVSQPRQTSTPTVDLFPENQPTPQ
jgi:cytoskeleton protein RodZ